MQAKSGRNRMTDDETDQRGSKNKRPAQLLAIRFPRRDHLSSAAVDFEFHEKCDN